MSILSLTAEEKFAAKVKELLARTGVHLTTGDDFHEYQSLLAEGRPDHVIGAPFDPSLHRLNDKNAIWVIGRDNDGKVMHAQALRTLNLQGRNLGTYLRQSFRDFPPSGLDIDMGRSRYRAGPGAKRIQGNVVYHGEVWMGGSPGQFRGTGVSSILGRFAFLTAIRKWAPDYVIGFMPKSVAYKGFVERQGYMHAEPYALQWYIKNNPKPLDGMMVYMSLEDMHFALGMPEEEMEAIAA